MLILAQAPAAQSLCFLCASAKFKESSPGERERWWILICHPGSCNNKSYFPAWCRQASKTKHVMADLPSTSSNNTHRHLRQSLSLVLLDIDFLHLLSPHEQEEVLRIMESLNIYISICFICWLRPYDKCKSFLSCGQELTVKLIIEQVEERLKNPFQWHQVTLFVS